MIVISTATFTKTPYTKNIAARPKKLKKPATSVTVVTKTLDATAGSIFRRSKKYWD